MIAQLLLLACTVARASPPGVEGTLAGTVVNLSRNKKPASQCEVVLCLRREGQLIPLVETKADARGKFVFAHLPLGNSLQYLPGANRDGVHYPGLAVALTADRPRADVELSVCDALAGPCPLVIRKQEILLRPQPGALEVTESMIVDNPSKTCYVGSAVNGDQDPVTLRLAIPSNFERTTFEKEFYGRRFAIAEGELATGIPWTPGQRELKFTYVLPNRQHHFLWERALDLPCDHVRVCVQTPNAHEVSCNLPCAEGGENGTPSFESSGPTLPAGHTIRVTLRDLPIPWMLYARWTAVAMLAIMIAAVSLATVMRNNRRPGICNRS